MSQRLICWVVSALMLVNTLGVTAAGAVAGIDPTQLPPKSITELEQTIDNYLALAGQLRKQIDRSQFDTDAVLDKLDYDIEKIAGFVIGEISFEPYAGLLRGPHGTLMARAGNSLDQSVLLAKLLNDAGYEARIAQASLPDDQINRLLSLTRIQPHFTSVFGDETVAKSIYRKMAALIGMTSSNVDQELVNIFSPEALSSDLAELRKAAQLETDAVIHVLKSNDVVVGGNDNLKETRDSIKQYFWVQYRKDMSNWLDLHPAYGGADKPEIIAEAFLKKEVPPELQHRVRLQARLLSVSGDQIKTTSLLSAWERPAANLAVQSITYSHVPLAAPEGVEHPWQYLTSGEIFVPVLNDKVASDNAFDLSGNVVPMMAVQSMAANLVKTVSDKAQRAESALAEIGESKVTQGQRFGISEVQLDLTLISPGGKERSYTRVIYDPCTDHQPVPDKNACFPDKPTVNDKLALTGTTTLAVSVGRIPESYILDRILERLIANEAIWKLQIDPARNRDFKAWMGLQLSDTSWLGFLPLFFEFDASNNPAHVFRASPSVVLFQQRTNQENQYVVSLDVLANKKIGLKKQNGTIQWAPEALIYEGVWETGAEFRFFNEKPDVTSDAAFSLSRKTDDKTGGRLVNNLNELAEWGRPMMKQAINDGYTIIVSNNSDEKKRTQVAWYRVNTNTGETLGMNVQGRGGYVEYLGKLMMALMVNAPIYWVGCAIAGYDGTQCVMFARTVAVSGLGAITFALALFSTIIFWPVDAH